MDKCAVCGEAKAVDALRCPFCMHTDNQVMQAWIVGTPSRALLVSALLGFWGYRFWTLGQAAWPGNLQVAAGAAAVLGLTALIFGPMWTFGVTSRRKGAIVLIVATAILFYLIFL